MKQHNKDLIVRLFFVLLIVSAYPILKMLLFIALVQMLSLYTHNLPVDSLIVISKNLLSYLLDALEYLTGISSTPPFPFSSWRNRYDP